MADRESKSLGDMLDRVLEREGAVRKRVGPSGPYYPTPRDALRDPSVIEAVKQADKLAERLNLKG